MKNILLSIILLATGLSAYAQGQCFCEVSLKPTAAPCCFVVEILFDGPDCQFLNYDKLSITPDPGSSVIVDQVMSSSVEVIPSINGNTACFLHTGGLPYFVDPASFGNFVEIGQICVSNPLEEPNAPIDAIFTTENTMPNTPCATQFEIPLANCMPPPVIPVDTTKLYGDTAYNAATRIKAFGDGIYVAAVRRPQNVDVATFSKFDLATGALVWERQLDFQSYFTDFELVPNGAGPQDDEFLLTGRSEPFQIQGVGPQNNESLLAKIDNNGNFLFIRKYLQTGREGFSRIIRHKFPDDPAFPYYILGNKNPPLPMGTDATAEDIMLLYNLDGAGNINWIREYNAPQGQEFEFHRGFFQVKSSVFMTGNDVPNNDGMFIEADNAGNVISNPLIFTDVWDIYGGIELPSSRIAVHGTDFAAGEAILFVYNPVVPPVFYGLRFTHLREFHEIGLDAQGRMYVTAQVNDPSVGDFWVICRVTDDGQQLTLDYAKYFFNGETGFTQGWISVTPEHDRIFYADGRLDNPNSFGNYDLFVASVDLDMQGDCVLDFDPGEVPLVINPGNISVLQDTLPVPNFDPGGTTSMGYACENACGEGCANDTDPPEIVCPPDIPMMNIAQCEGGAFVTYDDPEVTDDCPVTVVCNPPSGSFFPCGSNGAPQTTVVTCTATDQAGNVSTCTFDVTVRCDCMDLISSSIACSVGPNPTEYDFSITVDNLTGGTCNSVVVNSLMGNVSVVPGYTVTPVGTMFVIEGQVTAMAPIPLEIDLVTLMSCDCPGQQNISCSQTVTLTTPCCESVGLDDHFFCSETPEAYIPILGCNDLDFVDQIYWYISPGPCPGTFGMPFQVTDANSCVDLLLPVSAFDPGEYCIVAEVIQTSDAGPCRVLRTNEATVRICAPIGCSVAPAGQEYCDEGSPVTPQALVVTVNAEDPECDYTLQWQVFAMGAWADIPGATGTSYQPPLLSFEGAPEDCYFDHRYRVRVEDVCGARYCEASIRIFNNDAPVGVLEMDPLEPMPFCPGEDATMRYTPACVGKPGEPQEWAWFERTGSMPYIPLTTNGTMNPVYNTNKLYEDTWYKVEKKNGVCPVDRVEFLIEVKEPLAILDFSAVFIPLCDPIGVEMEVDFTPCCDCSHTVEWYKDGFLLASTSHTSSPASYLHIDSDVAGNYYAVVKDDCCEGQVQKTEVVTLMNPWVPAALAPCFFKTGGTAVLEGLTLNLPASATCTYEWRDMNGNLLSTNLTVTVAMGGTYTFRATCDGCIKEATVTLNECDLACMLVADREAPQAELPVKIFPNPADNRLTIQLEEAVPGRLEVLIHNTMGEAVFEQAMPPGARRTEVDISRLPAGLYTIQVRDERGGVFVRLFVKS